jgi:hypothetical protein
MKSWQRSQGGHSQCWPPLEGRPDLQIDMDVSEITVDPADVLKEIHTKEKNLPGRR